MTADFRAAVDGGSRGNPGPAAWGVAVLDQDGGVIERHADALGTATNNVAEYRALLEALKLAVQSGAESVEILADSELIVRQINGRYKVKNPGLKPLFAEAMEMVKGFASFRMKHVRREDNKEADRLVNQALNRAEAGVDPRILETAADTAADNV